MIAGPLEVALHAALTADPPDAAAVEAARLALVDQWDRLAWKEANRRHRLNPGTDVEDWHATARGALWDAATRFEPARGWTFGTFATWYLPKWCTPLARNEAAGGVHTPSNLGVVRVPVTPFGTIDNDDGGDFAGTVAGREPQDQPPDPAAVWAAVNAALPDERWRVVLRRRFIDGAKLDTIGEELGISRERVRQIEAKALEWLRDEGDVLAPFLAG